MCALCVYMCACPRLVKMYIEIFLWYYFRRITPADGPPRNHVDSMKGKFVLFEIRNFGGLPSFSLLPCPLFPPSFRRVNRLFGIRGVFTSVFVIHFTKNGYFRIVRLVVVRQLRLFGRFWVNYVGSDQRTLSKKYDMMALLPLYPPQTR